MTNEDTAASYKIIYNSNPFFFEIHIQNILNHLNDEVFTGFFYSNDKHKEEKLQVRKGLRS